jgi:hypothetical protein
VELATWFQKWTWEERKAKATKPKETRLKATKSEHSHDLLDQSIHNDSGILSS